MPILFPFQREKMWMYLLLIVYPNVITPCLALPLQATLTPERISVGLLWSWRWLKQEAHLFCIAWEWEYLLQPIQFRLQWLSHKNVSVTQLLLLIWWIIIVRMLTGSRLSITNHLTHSCSHIVQFGLRTLVCLSNIWI